MRIEFDPNSTEFFQERSARETVRVNRGVTES